MRKTGDRCTGASKCFPVLEKITKDVMKETFEMKKHRSKELKILAVMLIMSFGIHLMVSRAQQAGKRNFFYLDINKIKKDADVVVTGRLNYLPVLLPDDRMAYLGKLYHAMPDGVIKGQLPTNNIVGITRVLSSEGKPAQIESDKRFLLFLKEFDSTSKDVSDGPVVYRLVGNWQGIVALDKTAKERRAVISIEKQFGVKIDDMPEAFVEAIKASFLEHDAVAGETNSPVELSDEATAIFDALKLQIHQKKLDPSQTNNGGQTRSTP
jgi:hypothetical protein